MYRKEIISYCVSTSFVLIAALLHLLDYFQLVKFSVNAIVFFLYTFVILIWSRIMENRILRTSSKIRFRIIAYLLIGYLMMRTLKYEILYNHLLAIKYIRYGYYFFMLNIVHLVFFTSLLVAKSEREHISKWWNLLWIPTELLVALVLTNDFHGLAFAIDVPLSVESYKPLFFIILIYIALLTLGSAISALKPSFKTKSPMAIILPVSLLVLWGAYTFLYITDAPIFFYVKIAFKSAEFNILVVILFIEALIFTRLIPSNRGYERFLNMSSLKIGIMNMDGKIVFVPKDAPRVSSNLIKKSLGKSTMINKDTLLESAKITGGQSFWFIDLKELNSLKTKLYTLNESLMNENDLLIADKKLKENMAKLEEENEIRSYINAKLSPKFNRLNEIIENLPDDEDAFESSLKTACILSSYIKRYSNLFLLSKSKEELALSELGLAFQESLSYLNLSGVETFIDFKSSARINAQSALEIYEVFENILEVHYPYLSSMSVRLVKIVDAWEIKIDIESKEIFSIKDKIKNIDMGSKFAVYEDLDKRQWCIYIGGVII